MRITILGCGGSGGVPLADGTPGGNWGRADPANPRNRRQRVSILVQTDRANLLVDTSPDLRAQIIDSSITHLDALFYTHAHGDHCHGIDELRAFAFRRRAPIPAYMDAATRAELTLRFAYAMQSAANPGSLYKPLLDDRTIEDSIEVEGVTVTPFVQGHGGEMTSLGYRFDDVAYSTDVATLDDTAFKALNGVRLWIVDCLREEPHPTHAHFARTLEWIEQVRPERAVLTHMNHTVDYEQLRSKCPPGVEPAFDGMILEV